MLGAIIGDKEDIVKFIEPDDPSYNLSDFNGFVQNNAFDNI